jgi:small subunit ribosomal protein S9
MTSKNLILATGRRKTSVAQVRIIPNGEGKVTINSRPVGDVFRGQDHRLRDIMAPIGVAVEGAKKFDYALKITGGGLTGQAGAARHAIARAPKARKRFQYSKR